MADQGAGIVTRLACRRFMPLLVDHAEGGLAERERGAVERHVAECAECRAALEALRAAPSEFAAPVDSAVPDEVFFRRQRKDVMRAVRVVDGVLAERRTAARWQTGFAALAAGLLAVAGVRWIEPSAGPVRIAAPARPAMPADVEAVLFDEPMRLALLDQVGAMGVGDGLLADGDVANAESPLDDADLEALNDLFGSV